MKEENNSRLIDLLEGKDFNELSVQERNWVLSQISEEEYSKQRLLILDLSDALKPEDDNLIPAPLVLPSKGAIRTIPLYQAAMSVAAMALLLISIFSLFGNQTEIINNTEYIVKHDTVEVEKTIYDTVFQTIEKKIYISKEVAVPAENTECYIEESRLLESNPSINLPTINLVEIENTGTSLKDDATAILITNYLNL
jgi:hypothetical protein